MEAREWRKVAQGMGGAGPGQSGQPRPVGPARPVDASGTELRLEVLVRVGTALEGAADRNALLRTLCDSLVGDGGCVAAVADATSDRNRLVRVATAGRADACASLSALPSHDPLHRLPPVVALTTGRVHVVADVLADPTLAPWHEQASTYGINGLVSVPLRCRGQITAVLTLLSARPGGPGPDGALPLLAQSVGAALERLAVTDRLQQVLEERRLLQSRLLGLHQAECDRIAAVVRGEPVHLLAAMDLRLGLLRRQVAGAGSPVSTAVAQLHDAAHRAIGSLRELLFDLEPSDPELTLPAVLCKAADQIFEHSAVSVRIEVDDERADVDGRLADATRAQAVRMVREALITVRDHTDAGAVEVRLGQQPDGLVVTVADDGSTSSSPEVATIVQRAAAVGAVCRTDRSPRGTVVHLWLPFAAVVPGDSTLGSGDGRVPLRLVDLG